MRLAHALGTVLASIALSIALVSCGGGSSSPAPAAPVPNNAAPQNVTVTVNIPGSSPSGVRRTAYIGKGTASMAIFVGGPIGNGATQLAKVNCQNLLCQATVALAPGTYFLTVVLYDSSGNAISVGTVPQQQIIAGIVNNVNLTFNGVPVSAIVNITLPNSTTVVTSLTSGTPATLQLNVVALDSDNNQIIGPGAFVDPNGAAITIQLSSSVGTLSGNSVTGPGQAVTLKYDGTPVVSTTVVQILYVFHGLLGMAVGNGGQAGSFSIVVPPQVNINPSPVSLVAGTMQTVAVSEANYTGTFTETDTCSSIATVLPSTAPAASVSSSFTVTGVAAGTCKATFTDTNGNSVKVSITVTASPWTVTPTTLTLAPGATSQQITASAGSNAQDTNGLTLSQAVYPASCGTLSQSLQDYPPGSVLQDSFTFTASSTASGTCTISFSLTGSSAQAFAPAPSSVTVTVKAAPVLASTATLTLNGPGAGNAQMFTVSEAGYTGTFAASSTNCAGVASFSLNPASAPSGSVTVTATGLAAGTCTETFTDTNTPAGSASVTVTVSSPPPPPPPSVTVSPATVSIYGTDPGNAQTIMVSESGYTGMFTESDTTCSTVASFSPNPASAATGSAAFTVTGIGPGACTATFTDTNSRSATATITVTTANFSVSSHGRKH